MFGFSDGRAVHATAPVIEDGSLLALAVRSFRGTYAWKTSPLLRTLARCDLEDTALPIASIAGRGT